MKIARCKAIDAMHTFGHGRVSGQRRSNHGSRFEFFDQLDELETVPWILKGERQFAEIFVGVGGGMRVSVPVYFGLWLFGTDCNHFGYVEKMTAAFTGNNNG